jgi:hypothetical protein
MVIQLTCVEAKHHATLATSTLIILFEQMLHFFNSFFKYQNFVEENRESFIIFKNIL